MSGLYEYVLRTSELVYTDILSHSRRTHAMAGGGGGAAATKETEIVAIMYVLATQYYLCTY